MNDFTKEAVSKPAGFWNKLKIQEFTPPENGYPNG
jgi:hypothetical protein